jgi:predicted TIM-barrel fold metal-dependent hydrolase
VVFCSDGINEAANPQGEMFGFERIPTTIRAGCLDGLSAADLVDLLFAEVIVFASTAPQERRHDRSCDRRLEVELTWKGPSMPDNHTEAHSPDVLERETADNGFSAGWGLHMKPSVLYWLDCHTHIRERETLKALQAVEAWHGFLWGHRLRRHVAMDGTVDTREALADAARTDDRFLWLCWITHDNPSLEHLECCKALGATGVKLHNARMIIQGHDHKLLLSADWHRIYQRAGELGMPILWHVTQRLTDSPYTGGGSNNYWKDGWKNGTTYTNQDLLDDFLEIVSAHRDTSFIGAHQLHLGPERLAELFAQHPNLHVDTSIGCYLAPDDLMYPCDRERWYNFFVGNADRLLFGSDCVIDLERVSTELLRQHSLGHIRFLKQLNLPQDVLSKVAHHNFERLAHLEPVGLFPTGALRP